MATSDGLLINRVLQGDGKAFQDLIHPYKSLIYSVLIARVRQKDEVEDLEQEVYCRVFEELKNLRSAEQFGAWVWRIATNAAHTWGRRRARWQRCQVAELERLEFDGHSEAPDKTLENSQHAEKMQREVNQLAEPYGKVLRLYYMEGCSYKEIAKSMGLTLPTVKWRLIEGRKTLKRRLKRAA